MSKFVIHFYGPVTPYSFQCLRGMMLDSLSSGKLTEMEILLSSEGGDLNSGFTAYNFIRNFPIPVTCINMGTVESMAVILFLAADNRLAVENARFLLHSLHWGFFAGNVDHNRLSEHSDALSFDRDRYIQIFNDRTQGAKSRIDIAQYLNGSAKIVNFDSSVEAGILTSPTAATGIISSDDVHCWCPMIQ